MDTAAAARNIVERGLGLCESCSYDANNVSTQGVTKNHALLIVLEYTGFYFSGGAIETNNNGA